MSRNTKYNLFEDLKNIDEDNESEKESNMTQNQIAQLTIEEKKAYIKQYPYLYNSEYLLYHNKDDFCTVNATYLTKSTSDINYTLQKNTTYSNATLVSSTKDIIFFQQSISGDKNDTLQNYSNTNTTSYAVQIANENSLLSDSSSSLDLVSMVNINGETLNE